MRYNPRPYQLRMHDEIVEHDRLLATPPGTGKTAAVLHAIDTLIFDALTVGRVLIVAPKIVAEETWPDELALWDQFSRLTYRVWSAADFDYLRTETTNYLRPRDPDAFARRVVSDPSLIHIVSHDNFFAFALALGKSWIYDMLVLDESFNFSNPEARKYIVVRKYIRPALRRIVLLNGTPMANHPEQFFGQLLLVDRGATLGSKVGAYRTEYLEPASMDKRSGRVHSWKFREGMFGRLLQDAQGWVLSVLESEWIELPEMVIREIAVSIPRASYDQMEAEGALQFDDEAEALAINSGVLYGKLAQLAGGIVYDTDGNWHETHRVKLDALREVVEGHGGPLIIWVEYAPDRERILREFPQALPMEKIDRLQQRWNAGELPLIVAHPQQLAAGANLQHCPRGGMVWFSPTGNAVHWHQAIKRIWRSGRKDPVVCYVITARNTVEQKRLKNLHGRTRLHEAALEAFAIRRGNG